MAAQETTPTKKTDSNNSTSRGKQFVQTTKAWAAGFVDFLGTTAWPWCKDHIVSMAVLLGCPCLVAFYYWQTSNSEPAPLPTYLTMEDEGNSEANPARTTQREPLVSVVPEYIPTPVPVVESSPNRPNYLNPAGAERVAFPEPRPIVVESPKPMPEAVSAPVWPPSQPQTFPPSVPTPSSENPYATASEVTAVWLTGTIETADEFPPQLQNASRANPPGYPTRN